MYDAEYFKQELEHRGIMVMHVADAPDHDLYTNVLLASRPDIVVALNKQFNSQEHISIGCPLFAIASSYVTQSEDIAWVVLNALRPSQVFEQAIKAASASVHALTSTTQYNFLHLRIENDWQEHCKRWTAIPDGVIRDNCFNNTFTIEKQLQDKGLTSELPLYVASFWDDVNPQDEQSVKDCLQAAGYKLVTSQDIPRDFWMDREMSAMLEYHMALESEKFIGNSVSTLSGLQIIERHHRGLWASYYNGGDTPVAAMLPLDRLPWVFTYHSWSRDYDYMLKAAVSSGLQVAKLRPFCVFTGNTKAPIYAWLKSMNVTLLQHVPTWRNELLEKARPFMAKNVQHSHLSAGEDSLMGMFQSVDVPLLPTLRQFNFALFTDSDVFFTRHLTLADFPLTLPPSLGMVSEMEDIFPYNAGIMLMNLATLRRTYAQFLAFLLSNEHGMYFPNYGPGHQGAYNQFYASTVKGAKQPQAYNAKPYLHPRRDPSLSTFMGPSLITT